MVDEMHLRELNELEEYLKENGYNYDREDTDCESLGFKYEWHQIIVYDKNGEYSWDAVCHYGSYGFNDGLIEVIGPPPIVPDEVGDTVDGFLTAKDVISRIEKMEGLK